MLPVSGHVFPVAQMREDDPVDQEVTSLFFVLNLFYVGLGSGARRGFGVPIQRPGPRSPSWPYSWCFARPS